MTRLLTAAETAERLRVSKSTLYALARNGKIPVLRVGSSLRFAEDALEAWVRDKLEESLTRP